MVLLPLSSTSCVMCIMKRTANVEMLIVGNEILTGDIQDTNSNWLCKLMHEKGGSVNRVTVIPDVLDTIAQEVRAAVERGVDILFTSGGLGPTSDDLTLEGVAIAAGCGVEIHPDALEMLKKQFQHFFDKGIIKQTELTPARKKMACIPQNSEPLFNTVGIAPGVHMRIGETSVVCAPGIPSEHKAVVNQALEQFFEDLFVQGSAFSRRITVNDGGEAYVEPIITRISQKYPEIYTKSLAKAIGNSPELDVIMTISGVGNKEEMLNQAYDELCSGISDLGFTVTAKP